MNHRMEEYNPSKPCLTGLLDSTFCASERAESVLHLVQDQLVGDRTLDDSVLFAAIESVMKDLKDIKDVIAHFHDYQTKSTKKAPAK